MLWSNEPRAACTPSTNKKMPPKSQCCDEDKKTCVKVPVKAQCCNPTPVPCFDAFSCVTGTLAFVPMTVPDFREAAGTFPCIPASTCCTVPRCQRLRVVVIRACPWSPIPGAGSNVCLDNPTTYSRANQPWPSCQTPVTSGLPFKVNLAGSPVAVPLPGPPPLAIQAAYPTYASSMKTFEFDFGLGCNRQAEAKMVAIGLDGTVSASLKFVYTWCGAKCLGVTIPTSFTVTECLYNNVRFDVLDATTFLSSDPCTESYVILEIRQYCLEDEEFVPGGNGCLIMADGEPCTQPCKSSGLPCVDQTIMRKTLAWSSDASAKRKRYTRKRG